MQSRNSIHFSLINGGGALPHPSNNAITPIVQNGNEIRKIVAPLFYIEK
jgi:hypothetical protein